MRVYGKGKHSKPRVELVLDLLVGERLSWTNTSQPSFLRSMLSFVVQSREKEATDAVDEKRAHNLFQARVQVLNDELEQTFCRRYPGTLETQASIQKATA